MRRQKGFSLIELLIVVAIILIIAAIAIPNLLKSRIAANEASAVGSIRSIATTEISYSISNGAYTDLAGLNGANLIDATLGGGTKSGYTFTAAIVAPDFNAIATPVSTSTGTRSFCAFGDAVVRGQVGTISTCTTAISALG